MRIERWGGDAHLDILTDEIVIDGNFDLTTETKPADKDFELGKEEIHVILNNRPRKDVFSFPIETKNLTTVFQPPLTQQEILDGCIRPDKIINSYALYHSSQIGNKYKTGKFGHLLRLDLHDNMGLTTWCPYTLEKDLLTISPPKTFLNKAIFPITVGELTFGKTDQGGSNGVASAGYIRGSIYNFASGGTVTLITVYLYSTSSENAKVGAFDDDAGSPNALKIESTAQALSDGWNEFDVTDTVLAAGNYWLAFETESSGSVRYKYDGTGTAFYDAHTWNGWPNPCVEDDNTATRSYSIYATYTEAGEEAPPAAVNPFLRALSRGGKLRSKTTFKSTFKLD